MATPSRSAGEGGEVLGRSSTVELELRELAAEEILQLEVPLELPRGRWSSCLLDAVAVPVEVEQALDNNRLAVQVSL